MSKNKRVRKTKRHEAKINKRILKERREKKRSYWHFDYTTLFSSPLWFYRGIMHEIVLPIWGERDKAVLSGTMRPRPWSGRYATPDYSYSFYKNGTLYVKNSAISVENTSYHLGDSVDIMYLELMPFISSCVSPKR